MTTTKYPNLLLIALAFLGIAMLMCLGGIIWLSGAIPARPIPDVLIATTGAIVGAFSTLLVGTVSTARRDPR